MEVAQRNVQEIVKRDTEQIEDLVTRMEKLSEMLNETYDVMQDFHLLAQRSKAANVITDDILKVSLIISSTLGEKRSVEKCKV